MKVITANEKYDLYNPEDAARGILRTQKIDPANNEKNNASALFLREWAKRPIQVAAVAPSSKHLAKLMASEISAETGPVIEMGPGTGVFTRQLLANGVASQDLYLIEKNESFANLLKTRFPHLQVVNGDILQEDKELAVKIWEKSLIDPTVNDGPSLSIYFNILLNLGISYYYGYGCEKNEAAGLSMLRRVHNFGMSHPHDLEIIKQLEC